MSVFAIGGCNCGGDPVAGDGGNNGDSGDQDSGNNNGDGGDGDGGTGDGGDGDGSTGDGGGGDGGPTCLTEQEACAGKCGFVSDGCSGGFACNAGNGGIACDLSMNFCINDGTQCVPMTGGDGGTMCNPGTCETLGHECGMASDGCGGMITCGTTCPMGSLCLSAGQGQPQTCVMGTVACSGSLCDDLPTCSMASPTRLTGTVRTPGRPASSGFINRVPIPNAVLYIPADPGTALPTIFEGVDAGNTLSCGRCADEVFVGPNQSVLASAITDYAGNFTLEGRIPIGQPFKLVIKVGKWRRVVDVPALAAGAACTSTALDLQYTLMNAVHNAVQGDHLPHIAVSTGEVDAMECVLRNIGIADTEFTAASGTGRVHMYRGSGDRGGARMRSCTGTTNNTGTTTCYGSYYDVGTSTVTACTANGNAGCNNNYPGCARFPNGTQCNATINGVPNAGCNFGRTGCTSTDITVGSSSNLYGNSNDDNNVGRLNEYDMVVWDCEGAYNDFSSRRDTRVFDYVENGGRMFASHFAYTWIEDNGTLDMSADWGNGGTADTATALVSMPSGTNQRTRANPVKSLVFRDWLNNLGALQMAATSPRFAIVDARDRAGENVGSTTDEWVYRISGGTSRVQQLSFNTPYGATDMTACGRVAYTGFHVASDDSGAQLDLNDSDDFFPHVCPIGPLRPQELSLVFMLFDLNACVSSGDPVTPPTCTALTEDDVCPTVNSACGFISDGCGGVINCGGCDPGNFCTGNTCNPYTQCVPKTCVTLGPPTYVCGQFPDTCGGIADNAMGTDTGCGACPMGQVCGPTGQCQIGCTPIPNPCGTAVCGTASNGCGQTVSCGTCPDTRVCNAGMCIFID